MELRPAKKPLPHWAETTSIYGQVNRFNYPPELHPDRLPGLFDLETSVSGKKLSPEDADLFLERIRTALSKRETIQSIVALTVEQVGGTLTWQLIRQCYEPLLEEEARTEKGLAWISRREWPSIVDRQQQSSIVAKGDAPLLQRELRYHTIRLLFEFHWYPVVDEPFRDVTTSKMSKETKRLAWRDARLLSQLPSTEVPSRYFGLSKKLRTALDHVFRVDLFGNVISLYGKSGSACALHYDHYFPRSRGGRTDDLPHSYRGTATTTTTTTIATSVMTSNIHALHVRANLSKSKKLPMYLRRMELQIGYSVCQFVSALTSVNGVTGIPLMEHALGYDILDGEDAFWDVEEDEEEEDDHDDEEEEEEEEEDGQEEDVQDEDNVDAVEPQSSPSTSQQRQRKTRPPLLRNGTTSVHNLPGGARRRSAEHAAIPAAIRTITDFERRSLRAYLKEAKEQAKPKRYPYRFISLQHVQRIVLHGTVTSGKDILQQLEQAGQYLRMSGGVELSGWVAATTIEAEEGADSAAKTDSSPVGRSNSLPSPVSLVAQDKPLPSLPVEDDDGAISAATSRSQSPSPVDASSPPSPHTVSLLPHIPWMDDTSKEESPFSLGAIVPSSSS